MTKAKRKLPSLDKSPSGQTEAGAAVKVAGDESASVAAALAKPRKLPLPHETAECDRCSKLGHVVLSVDERHVCQPCADVIRTTPKGDGLGLYSDEFGLEELTGWRIQTKRRKWDDP